MGLIQFILTLAVQEQSVQPGHPDNALFYYDDDVESNDPIKYYDDDVESGEYLIYVDD